MNTPDTKTLLIVWHSRTGAALQMARAARRGAQAVAQELQADIQAGPHLRILFRAAARARPADVLAADGILFSAPENLAALSGAMKEFFDRCYYPVLDRINGRPYALMISAGSDGASAVRQAERICTGWRLTSIAPALIVCTHAQTPERIAAPKRITADDRARCETLGGTLAALLL
ncbi:flavodoxin family protein [Candidimonas nitroreducens]|uniref:Flavodoxin n=1 Tax=Candidimonas nitroreducens TaxID=683354 RepID=A0A225M3S9_9BURK|nr:NAD(P)H-dependent oxidoreductase [Candidimonas nitroreducens]OWT53609.1 flavodoxin [Candidimonas nitroreducens]